VVKEKLEIIMRITLMDLTVLQVPLVMLVTLRLYGR
jgi:hypothetical protein